MVSVELVMAYITPVPFGYHSSGDSIHHTACSTAVSPESSLASRITRKSSVASVAAQNVHDNHETHKERRVQGDLVP